MRVLVCIGWIMVIGLISIIVLWLSINSFCNWIARASARQQWEEQHKEWIIAEYKRRGQRI